MHLHGKRFIVGVVVGFVLGLPLAALADPIEGMNWGANPPHTLCVTCEPDTGNLIGVWQSFLWGDGFHNKCGTAGIDGVFGSITKADTKDWQSYHQQTVDGVVGSGSWGHAFIHVVHESGNDYHYSGVNHNIKLLTQGSTPVQWWFDTPTPVANEPGTEFVWFSPSEELRRVEAVMMKSMRAMQDGSTP